MFTSCEKDEVKKDRVDFESFNTGEDDYYNGDDLAGSFTIGNVIFPNNYNPDYSSWLGFSVSSMKDTETRGLANQYSAIFGSGADGSEKYAVFYTFSSDTLEFIIPQKVTNISVCNSTYVYYSMLEGDSFAKKFGGESGDDPDFFKLVMKGINEAGNPVFESKVNLADYTFDNSNDDYISNAWTDIDLSQAGYIKKIVMSFESSDVGSFGINTPQYVCIDNIFGELESN